MVTSCSISSSDMSSSSSSRGHSSHLKGESIYFPTFLFSPSSPRPPWFSHFFSLILTWTGQCQTGSPVWLDKRNQRTHNSHHGTTWGCSFVKSDSFLLPLRSKTTYVWTPPVRAWSHGGAGCLALVPAHALPHVGHRAVHRHQAVLPLWSHLWRKCYHYSPSHIGRSAPAWQSCWRSPPSPHLARPSSSRRAGAMRCWCQVVKNMYKIY